jgi:hypothetical protein
MWVALSDETPRLSFSAVRISSICHLCLQFYMSAFYAVICQESGFLWICAIYSSWFACPVGPRNIASGRTQQKTPLLVAATLHIHAAAGADRAENIASESSSIVACEQQVIS